MAVTLWPPITRDDLRAAAGRAGFDTTFPLLVRRLIAETADGLTELDMPGGSGVAAGGFDGIVTAAGQTLEVPAGTSVWELSITDNSGKKADDDYGKRLTGPDGGSTDRTTYVQVILSAWTKGRSWAADRSKEGRWKQVRALNLDAVHAWLDHAPATTAWLADQLGKTVPGVRSLADWFEQTWLPSTRIALGEEYILAGRDAAAGTLLAALIAGQATVTIKGELTGDEFLAFVAAALTRAETPVRDVLQARALVVSDPGSLAQLMAQQAPLVFVMSDPRLAASLPARHPHQLVLLVPSGNDATVTVDRVDAQVVSELLRACGEPWERATSLGALARRSLPGLRRTLAVNPASLAPSWVDGADTVHRRLLLIGSWDGSNPADRDVLQTVTGRPYADVEDVALALAAAGDTPMLGRLADHWHLLAPADAWMLLSSRLTRDDLTTYIATVKRVLSESDPFVGMDVAARLRAQWAGTSRQYSATLRQGLARTLALLGSTDSPLPATSWTTGADLAREPVREILAAANADRSYCLWTSLTDVLGLLAEAAPEEFLTAMRDGLQTPEPLHTRMFTDAPGRDGLLGSPATHSEFLWALQALAWSPEHFDDVVDVLAGLAALDPGGRYSNRPSQSLADVFSCWHPTTGADDAQRMAALRRLLRTQPDVARRLLVDLIPDGPEMQMAQGRPRFRAWKRDRVMTREQVRNSVAAVVDLLLDDLQDRPERFLALLAKVDRLSPDHRKRLADGLTALSGSLDDATRAMLYDALREKAARHREYAGTAWALPDDELRVLEQAAAAIAPRSAVLETAWLFASDWVELGDRSRRDDLAVYDAAVRERRADAVGRVLQEGGLDAIAQLAEGTRVPQLVGVGLAAHTDTFDGQMLTWLEEDGARSAVGFAYLSQRLRDGGDALLDELLTAATSAEAKAAILRATYRPLEAWDRLRTLDAAVADAYWQNFSYYGLGPDFAGVVPAAQGLISVGRWAAALNLLSLYADQATTLDAAQLAATACEGLLAAESDPDVGQLSSHDLNRVVQLLDRHRDAIGNQRIINIEWQLFPAFGFEPSALALHSALTADPAFFAEIVGYAYDEDNPAEALPAEEPDGAPDATGAAGEDDSQAGSRRRDMALRAFDVLRSWHGCPGTGPDGTVDSDDLRDWVIVARDLLRSKHRTSSGDEEIGRVLAHAAPDVDGTFPPRAVRDLLEELVSDQIEQALECEIINKRGIVSRGTYDGGDKEQVLAEEFRTAAEQARTWPRTRRILRRMADWYEREARLVDNQAERHRRGLHE